MLARNGACAFGVVAADVAAAGVPVGTQDAATVIREAVKRFGGGNSTAATNGTGSGSTLGAAGAFQCGVNPSTMVNWALYHAP
ncbi:hypothetical protein GGR52DRAFT_551876 [Hypoxylon sp. FL1284]|nr:hypothetical protein GGR52DRAFT_551876 [Hypoxylon sp. FL1284]